MHSNYGSRPSFGARPRGYHGTRFIDFERAPMHEIRQHLAARGLDATGSDGVLRSRLQRFVAPGRQGLSGSPAIEYLVVMDFEASCADDDLLGERPKAGSYEQEIIEFPAILIDVKRRQIVPENGIFHTYVQPTQEVNKKLTAFCTKLTGITQDMVAKAPLFPVALKQFEDWLTAHNLLGKNNWTTAVDGRFDHCLFIFQSCKINGKPFPEYMISYLKLPRTFKFAYKYCFLEPGVFPPNLEEMLTHYGMKFEGIEHHGLDDAKNMARIAVKMLTDQIELRPTDKVHPEEIDEERPYCCKARALLKDEWEEMRKTILDPNYVPKTLGVGDERPWQTVQSLLAHHQLNMTGSEGIQRSRLILHETWLRYGMEKPIVFDYIVILNLEAFPDLDEREPGSFPQNISHISAAVVDVEQESTVSEFDQFCQVGDVSTSALSFFEVFNQFRAWLAQNNCVSYPGTDQSKFCILVSSRYSLPFHLYTSCTANHIKYPPWALTYTRIDSIFKKFYGQCCPNVALPKFVDIFAHFQLSPASGGLSVGTDRRHDLEKICLQMIRDKVPLQLTDRLLLDRPEGPNKPHSRLTQGVQDRDWFNIRQQIAGKKLGF